MASLLEMAWDVVSNNESITYMSKDQILNEIQETYNGLAAIEKGEAPEVVAAQEEVAPVISLRKAMGKKSITCMICGKGGMKTLTRHLKTAHDMKPGEYRKQFGIPTGTPLAAKDYSEIRRQMAIEKGLGEGLAKARAARGKAKAQATQPAPAEESKPKTVRRSKSPKDTQPA